MSKRKNKRKSRANGKIIRFFTALIVLSIVTCIILFANKNITNADENGDSIKLNKYYKTITIENGDTLWDIANTYKSGDYRTTKDYVDELMQMNNLHNDSIMSGQKLVVAYFDE